MKVFPISVAAIFLTSLASAQSQSPPPEDFELTKSKQLKHAVAEGAEPTDIAYSPDGKWIATTHEDGSAWLCSPRSGQAKRFFKSTTEDRYPSCVAFSPDGKELAIGIDGGEKNAVILRVGIGKGAAKLPQISIPGDVEDGETYPGSVFSVAYQPGEAKYLAAGCGERIRLYDRASSKEVAAVLPAKQTSRIDVEFADGGKKIISCGDEFVLRILSVPDLAQVGELTSPGQGKIDSMEKFSISADRSTVATTGTAYLQAWDLKTQKSTYLLQGSEENDNEYFSSRTALSPDGSVIVSQEGGMLLFFTGADPEDCVNFQFEAHPDDSSIRELAFSPDGKQFASIDENGLLILWETKVTAAGK